MIEENLDSPPLTRWAAERRTQSSWAKVLTYEGTLESAWSQHGDIKRCFPIQKAVVLKGSHLISSLKGLGHAGAI